jgi:ketosteroid isomerase-like protein/mannose-6-phosphate isomerase-like protein (cupin superfamily)
MSRSFGFLVAAAYFLTACGPSVNVEQEREALLQLDREWSQSTGDVDKFVSYYSPDAKFYPSGMPLISGAEAIKQAYGQLSALPGFSLQWTPAEAEVSSSGDLGYVTGSFDMTANDPAGKPAVEHGKYIAIYRKQADGQWKVVEDIFNPDAPPPDSSQHVMMAAPTTLTWQEGPPGLPAGAKVAVLAGNPMQPGPYTLRAQLPAGYRIPPHWHPTAEHLTLLSGTMAVGMGDQFDEAAMTDIRAGGFVALPPDMRHYLLSKTATTLQVHGRGPFTITYVNPADDPRPRN